MGRFYTTPHLIIPYRNVEYVYTVLRYEELWNGRSTKVVAFNAGRVYSCMVNQYELSISTMKKIGQIAQYKYNNNIISPSAIGLP